MPKNLSEFEIIAKYFSPLAQGSAGALGLTDDVALLEPREGCQLVLTKDILTENVHFFTDDDPRLLAKKLLRVNLSDLAAKGAKPMGYLLGLVLPKETGESWFASFAEGLAEDNKEFGITLLGGDTVSHAGALSLSLTAVGEIKSGQAILRKGARTGDNIYVTGTLGDSALGLQILKLELEGIEEKDVEYLTSRYFLPQPRVALGKHLPGIVSAGMDISDGLIQDLGHLCHQSGVGAMIEFSRLPLSQSAKAVISHRPDMAEQIATGGDDYELLLTAPEEMEDTLVALAAKANVALTNIGRIVKTPGVICYGGQNNVIRFKSAGYQHF